MNKPEMKTGLNRYSFSWKDWGIRVDVDRLRDEGIGELYFYHENGTETKLLHFTRANLLSTQTCSQLAKRLTANIDIDWNTILTYVSKLSLEEQRKGEPAHEIWPRDNDNLGAEYLLEPILYLNQPTVLFGEYGSCKSLISLVLAYISQLPCHDNMLGLITKKEPDRALFLDYEDDREDFNKRWSALGRGFEKGATPILYRRMMSPLYDNVEQVQRIVYDNKIKLVIVDSLGPAARGNLNDPEPAIRYYEALRTLRTKGSLDNELEPVTSLTLAHTAKDPVSRKRTIFGSVFFTNLARAVWECKADGEDPVTVSLKRTKANLSRREATLGFNLIFEDSTIKVQKSDLQDTGLAGELPIPWQIQHLLKSGSLSIKDIAEELGKGDDTIRITLKRMEKKDIVVKLPDGKWGLKVI